LDGLIVAEHEDGATAWRTTQPAANRGPRLTWPDSQMSKRSGKTRSSAGVITECLDFAEFIRRYDRPTTLFYLDPPNWGCETYYGRGLFARADFERLARQLKTIRGRFLMSLNDVPAVRATFAGFRFERVATTYRANVVKRVTKVIISGGDGQPRRA
jgi:site-specific DNA-adenine methylase